jgi:hypothetical protein
MLNRDNAIGFLTDSVLHLRSSLTNRKLYFLRPIPPPTPHLFSATLGFNATDTLPPSSSSGMPKKEYPTKLIQPVGPAYMLGIIDVLSRVSRKGYFLGGRMSSTKWYKSMSFVTKFSICTSIPEGLRASRSSLVSIVLPPLLRQQ